MVPNIIRFSPAHTLMHFIRHNFNLHRDHTSGVNAYANQRGSGKRRDLIKLLYAIRRMSNDKQ
jgi:hypothetical protein